MKKTIEILLLVTVLIAAGCALVFSTRFPDRAEMAVPGTPASPVEEGSQETTIRNMIEETVHYRLRSIRSDSWSEEKALEKGQIDRIGTAHPLVISFMRGGEEDQYQLAQGKPYTFRYDEHNFAQIYEGSHGRSDAADLAPFVPTPMNVVEKMLEMARVDSGDIVYDIGCGDGRIVIKAAQTYGAQGVGIEIDPFLIEESRAGARTAGVEGQVEFLLADATTVDISRATVVAMYLLPESCAILRPQLERLESGSMVVTHDFHIPGWEDKLVESKEIPDITGSIHTIFLYRR